jgi:hypothetical protein
MILGLEVVSLGDLLDELQMPIDDLHALLCGLLHYRIFRFGCLAAEVLLQRTELPLCL